jgi:hypothetical protein
VTIKGSFSTVCFNLKKKEEDDLIHLAFLLSVYLRDYPLNDRDFSPSVLRSKTGIFPGLN